ncbi:MAG: hypothetical protein CO020_00500 [Candidatus Colwellbacteria bacterium CG_4_9_14_0_2_um_filter_50_12]|uniref:ATP-dependent Clp protease proteolytic subunit n=1 Tax=Candidatus Colwellbacteria bacterium CG_4_9_14_0_2_um_filter_50_12 TaxID=1974538 RepID=A0A2M8G1D3_9BACT|nr:MAG: hypothetical protein CO020_00500 [Candidatus Colwellbacteria bacterium CG_4_9_14_0_2_um_filter_50_12]
MNSYIVFTAGVDKITAAKLRAAVTDAFNSGVKEITIFISSNGGDVFEGLGIAAFIRALEVPVVTHNIGQIDSVANVIFAAGKERLASPNSSFLFHGVVMNFEKVSLLESQLEEQLTNVKRLKESMATNYSSYTGVPVRVVNDLMAKGGGGFLSAKEALVLKIIDSIEDPIIPTGVNVISIGNS